MAADTPEARDALVELERICSGLPEVNVRLSHHTPTFFIRDKKVLCHLWDHDRSGAPVANLWCPAEPGVQEELIESDPERFFVPPYVGHRGWIGLRLDVEPDWDEVEAILHDAYRVVAPRTLARQLDDQELS